MSWERILTLGILMGIACLFVIAIIGFTLLIEKKRRELQEKKMAAESNLKLEIMKLEEAMVAATRVKLEEAVVILAKAGVALYPGHTKLPNIFWEVSKIWLICHTMVTCATFFNRKYAGEYGYPPLYIFSELRAGLLSLVRTDPERAIDIAIHIGFGRMEGTAAQFMAVRGKSGSRRHYFCDGVAD